MVKNNVKDRALKGGKLKKRILLILILVMIPNIFTIYTIYFKQRIVVGIMITNDDLTPEAEVAQTALDDYHNIFEARILDTRLFLILNQSHFPQNINNH